MSAVTAGKKDVEKAIQKARLFQKKTILFLDEIHRFNRAQQDFLLPSVERGTIILIGATTENPSFEIISSLLSRSSIFILKELEEAIADKIVIDTTVSMSFEGDDGPVAAMPEAGSAAEEAASLLPNANVVSAFHHLDAKQLQRLDRPMQGDVIVCGDDKSAKQKVMALAEEINYVRALDGGALKNSRYSEQLTVLLVHINKIYQAHTGIRVTGV